ncbi:MAG TPA: hypothetical protein VGU45_09155 [Microvirga sp.]|nr:hypothetical protein [Microvirga sp.]
MLSGTFILRFRDGSQVVLKEGDSHIVPRGVEHLAVALLTNADSCSSSLRRRSTRERWSPSEPAPPPNLRLTSNPRCESEQPARAVCKRAQSSC